MEMSKGPRERNGSSKESKSAPEGMPKGETEKGDAGGQVASYAGTFMKNAEKGRRFAVLKNRAKCANLLSRNSKAQPPET